MLRRPPRATRTDTPYPSPTCFLSPASDSDGSLFRFDRIRRIEILAVIGVLIGSVAVDTLLVVFETEVGLPEPVGIAFSDVAEPRVGIAPEIGNDRTGLGKHRQFDANDFDRVSHEIVDFAQNEDRKSG